MWRVVSPHIFPVRVCPPDVITLQRANDPPGAKSPSWCFTKTLEHTGYAALDLGSLQGVLTQTHIVKGLNAFTPSINIVLVYLASSDGIRVEQG